MQPKPYAYARKNVVECGAGDMLRDVARHLKNESVGSTLVKDSNGAYVGMLTEAIIFEAIAEGMEVEKLHVRDLKLMPYVSASKDAGFDEVMDIFNKNGVSRLAMTDEKGRVVGVLKKANLDRFASYRMASTISSLKK